MLHINPAQLESLAVPYEAEFLSRVREFLRLQTPHLVEHAGPSFEQRLEGGLHDARALGIESEQEQVLHLVMCLQHGVGFASREPWAVAVVEAHRDAGYGSGLSPALMRAAPRGGSV